MMADTIETVPYVASDPSWQLPRADLNNFSPKRHSYVLVIPVINEGDRILRQLKAIKELAPKLDIAIVDGGSTDGSIDPKFLMVCGVRALLVKRSRGGLSAQLRIAYAWALDQGYLGVLTMDGNGKDGVEALPAFIDALDAGADYVQGSRYEKGGKAINTPLDRWLGVRLIHAPLISLASGRWMGDTTNGFRSYSRRLLEDDRVMPFREIFDRYNLLFYLAIRANRLGYKVRELPVERRYPDPGEMTPTKISGFASKMALLGETLDAATGAFTPASHSSAKDRSGCIDAFVIGLSVTMVALFFFNFLNAPGYSPDSWAYYELSQTIFGDFYRFSHFRTYVTDVAYGSSFPPLWPTLIAIVDTVIGTGARTGYGLAFAMFVAFAIMSELIGQAAFQVRWVGTGVALLTLIDNEMLSSEMVGGRSIPLQMFLYATIMYVLLEKRDLRVSHGVVLGVLAGLAVMNRFDALLVPGVICVGLLFFTRRLSVAFAFGISVAVIISPWVYYSMDTFGTLFMTDNATVARAVDVDTFVTDWWPDARPTVFDDPVGWIRKVVGNLHLLFWRMWSIIGSEMGIALLLSAALGRTFVVVTAEARIARPDHPAHRTLLCDHLMSHKGRVFALFLLAFSVVLSAYIVTGYFDSRYFAPILWLGSLIGAGLFVQWGQSVAQRRTLSLLCFGFLSALTFIGLSFHGMLWPSITMRDRSASWEEFERPAIVTRLEACLVGVPMDIRLLVIGDSTLAARLGALARRHAMLEPRNMARGKLDGSGIRQFLDQWRVDYVLVTKHQQTVRVQTTFPVLPVPGCDLDLYRVDRRTAASSH